MVATRSANGKGRGRGKEEVQGKRKKICGFCPDSNPSGKLKGNEGMNYRKVEATKNQSSSVSSSVQLPPSSDSSQLSFKLSPPAQENPPFNILCYSRRQATASPPLTGSLMRTPRRVGPQLSPRSMDITDMAELIGDESSESDSVCGSEGGVVYVEGYKVRPQYAVILNTIISKHGDIGANGSSQSHLFLFSMELLCQKVLELQANTILTVTKKEITNMQACICEVERQNIEVGWLKTRLDDILRAKLAVPILRHSRMLRGEWKEKARTLKGQLHALQEKINATEQELSHAESEATSSDLSFFESRAKLEHVSRLGSLISGLI